MKYMIHAALRDDISEGWVWIDGLPSRTIVRIINEENGKSVYCEALAIDDNFLRSYNCAGRVTIDKIAKTLVLSEWYRRTLGNVETQRQYDLSVSIRDNMCGQLLASLDHPQIVVRLAMRLAILSVSLGIVGVLLGAISLL
jgi:hypothetical protein